MPGRESGIYSAGMGGFFRLKSLKLQHSCSILAAFLQHSCSTLQHFAALCSTLQHSCSTLQQQIRHFQGKIRCCRTKFLCGSSSSSNKLLQTADLQRICGALRHSCGTLWRIYAAVLMLPSIFEGKITCGGVNFSRRRRHRRNPQTMKRGITWAAHAQADIRLCSDEVTTAPASTPSSGRGRRPSSRRSHLAAAHRTA